MFPVSRRHSIQALGVALVGASLPPAAALARQRCQFGYAAITWGGNDRQAITDIAEVGFRGIQVRTAAVQAYGDRPGELKDLLAEHQLTLVALSSGTIGLDPARSARWAIARSPCRAR